MNHKLKAETSAQLLPRKFVKAKDFQDETHARLNKFAQKHMTQLNNWFSYRLLFFHFSRVNRYMETRRSFDFRLLVSL